MKHSEVIERVLTENSKHIAPGHKTQLATKISEALEEYHRENIVYIILTGGYEIIHTISEAEERIGSLLDQGAPTPTYLQVIPNKYSAEPFGISAVTSRVSAEPTRAWS